MVVANDKVDVIRRNLPYFAKVFRTRDHCLNTSNIHGPMGRIKPRSVDNCNQ